MTSTSAGGRTEVEVKQKNGGLELERFHEAVTTGKARRGFSGSLVDDLLADRARESTATEEPV